MAPAGLLPVPAVHHRDRKPGVCHFIDGETEAKKGRELHKGPGGRSEASSCRRLGQWALPRYSRSRLHLDGAHLLQQAVSEVGTLGRELTPLALEVLQLIHSHLEGQR